MQIQTAQNLGELIRAVRRSRGLTQVQLAAAAGTGERFIVDLERGKGTCELGKALKIARMLGIIIEAAPRT